MADAVDELPENAILSLSRFLGSCMVLSRCWHGASLQWQAARWFSTYFFSSFFGALRRAGHTLDAMLCTFRNPAEQSQKFGGSNPNMKITKPE